MQDDFRKASEGRGSLDLQDEPEVFGPDEEGYGTVLQADVSGEALAQAERGALGCPEAAISLEES